jgi:hypothetical protein
MSYFAAGTKGFFAQPVLCPFFMLCQVPPVSLEGNVKNEHSSHLHGLYDPNLTYFVFFCCPSIFLYQFLRRLVVSDRSKVRMNTITAVICHWFRKWMSFSEAVHVFVSAQPTFGSHHLRSQLTHTRCWQRIQCWTEQHARLIHLVAKVLFRVAAEPTSVSGKDGNPSLLKLVLYCFGWNAKTVYFWHCAPGVRKFWAIKLCRVASHRGPQHLSPSYLSGP